MATTPTGQEKEYYDQLFDAVSKDDSGLLPGRVALPLLTASGLPQQTLGEIWTVADPENNGFLTRETWYNAARLVGWLQKGGQAKVEASLAFKTPPLPTFNGYPGPPMPNVSALPPLSANATGQQALAPLTPADRTQFTRIFVGCGPSNGLVSGDKARDVFLKSKLNYDKLGQIWNLADTQQRGALDLPDFIVGMWLIRNCMANPSLSLPATLPPGAYEAASGGRAPTGPLSVQNTGPASPIQRQMTGTLQPQLTGQSLSAAGNAPSRSAMTPPTRQGTYPRPSSTAAVAWDITPEAKVTSDRFFAQLDTQNRGVIKGDVAVPFMLQSQLDEASLATIWDLSDIRQEGKLDRDEFAVAMHLISSKLAGKELPASLPTSLIPPALRSLEAPVQTQPSSTAKDLFDLFDDPPTQPPMATPTAFLPQPPSRRGTAQESTARQLNASSQAPSPSVANAMFSQAPASADLLGDDGHGAAISSVPDTSAEIGNKRNQLANTTRSVADLERNRADLEQQSSSNTAQLEQLESELSTARAKYGEETKLVAELRIRVGEQTDKLRQLQADVISAQSDLTARKMEKDELEQAFLRDKEEVRGLQKRMKELEDEKTGLKLLLEKVKKDARQQKGMVSIAKKQLSTAEGSRDSLQQELRDAEKQAVDDNTQASPTVETTAAPRALSPETFATPRVLSPEATGTSHRSYNPFDRYSRKRSNGSASGSFSDHPTSLATPALAGAGAVGGVTAAILAADHSGSPEESSNINQHSFVAPATTDMSDVDAFGAPVGEFASAPGPASSDPFRMDGSEAATAITGPGFGDSFNTATHNYPTAEATAGANQGSDFDAAFADFDVNENGISPESVQSNSHVPNSDDGATALQSPGATSVPVGITKSSAMEAGLQPEALRPEAERTASTQALPPTSAPASPPTGTNMTAPLSDNQPAPAFEEVRADSSDDEDEGPEDLEGPRQGYSAATPEPPMSPSAAEPSHFSKSQSAGGAMSVPLEDGHQKTRRSAPPPPVVRSPGAASPPTTDAVDPFGPAITSFPMTVPPVAVSPRATSPPSGTISPKKAGPPVGLPEAQDPFGGSSASFSRQDPPIGGAQAAQFDDEGDFDFSDLPIPASTQKPSQAPAASSFDDEFANFDEDFDKAPSQLNSSPDNSNSILQSYEVVPSPRQDTGAPNLDEWGLSSGTNAPAAGGFSTFSFDDAFEQPQQPTTHGEAGQQSFDDAFGASQAAAPKDVFSKDASSNDAFAFDDTFGGDFPPGSGPSNGGITAMSGGESAPPALPKRPSVNKEPASDLPQADDLEDVKRLCGMGFPRSLVVEALDANGYDFQKALNVLLVK